MDLKSLVLAPVRVPLRLAQALDDLADLAERARRDPDPVEEVRVRLDALLVELHAVNVVAREIRDGGRDLNATGRQIVAGGQDLTAVSTRLERDTRELIDGGQDLTAVSRRIEQDLRIFRAALPKILELEDAVETVAETIEPLQGAAERVGRVTSRLSRSRS